VTRSSSTRSGSGLGAGSFYLGIVIVATVALYYELYVGGSVAHEDQP
jgi:hypothetical protein